MKTHFVCFGVMSGKQLTNVLEVLWLLAQFTQELMYLLIMNAEFDTRPGSRPGGVTLIRYDLPGGLTESHKMAHCVSQSALRENAAPSPYPQHRSEERIRIVSADVGFNQQALFRIT